MASATFNRDIRGVLFDWGDTLVHPPGITTDTEDHFSCIEAFFREDLPGRFPAPSSADDAGWHAFRKNYEAVAGNQIRGTLETGRELSTPMIKASEPIPLMLVTGFLGSGKTTLLNALLRHPDLTGTAVLMNEIGTVGIDHSLVVGASDDILLLEGGCLCCQPKGSVAEGVSRLLALEPRPKRIIIETSGAANPIPILETLSQHPQAATEFQFPRVITVVDSVFGRTTLERHPEVGFQLAAADIVVIGKTDVANASEKTAIEALVIATSPTANCIAWAGDVLPDGFIELLRQPVTVANAQSAEAVLRPEQVHGEQEFESVGLQFDGCLETADVQDWIDQVLELYGSNLLRIKGILNLKEYERPAVLHCVRDIVHPIEVLDERAGQVRGNRIVAIGWDIHPELLREALATLAGQAK